MYAIGDCLCAKFDKIGARMVEEWFKDMKNRNKMAVTRPYWIVSQNKLTCICMP